MCTSSGSRLHSGSTGTMLPSRNSVVQMIWWAWRRCRAPAGCTACTLESCWRVPAPEATARIAVFAWLTVSLRGPPKPKSMNGKVFNCVGTVMGSASCPTKSGEAHRNSSRLKTFRAISVESCSGPVPNTTSKPSLIGSTMLSTNRMSKREWG